MAQPITVSIHFISLWFDLFACEDWICDFCWVKLVKESRDPQRPHGLKGHSERRKPAPQKPDQSVQMYSGTKTFNLGDMSCGLMKVNHNFRPICYCQVLDGLG
ncbi:hypothetical protein ILYODFUR_034987 [Ilyodon furcidens]|uniref:Uncharacterized protein n=1 Tax=Ilyodon furcidens TaxID=33524 RepID=A0ABV0UPG7_9TELE